MPFGYFRRLGPRQKAIYRRSDGIRNLPLPPAPELAAAAWALDRALRAELPPPAQRLGVGRAAARLAGLVCQAFGVAGVEVRVLHRRPRDASGELHGLYTQDSGGRVRIDVWMRTARREQVVAFRTFLRTLLHELCHHLDYALLELADSFHTEGFYAREAHLTRQVLERMGARASDTSAGSGGSDAAPGQLDLPF
jgi:hypothetical protein